jgi:formylglycine-generating enzyme required for sulfatase activity
MRNLIFVACIFGCSEIPLEFPDSETRDLTETEDTSIEAEDTPTETEDIETEDLPDEISPDEVEDPPDEILPDEVEDLPDEIIPDEVEDLPDEIIPDEVEDLPEDTCPFTLCEGTCVNTSTDMNNCGECGIVCESNQYCAEGCYDILCTHTLCNEECIDTSTDMNNCGGCGVVCNSDQYCNEGCINTCPNTLCNGDCVDTSTDMNNCGGCGITCNSNQYCEGECIDICYATLCGEECVDTSTNTNHCGNCGVTCNPNQDCCDGDCIDLNTPYNCNACGDTCSTEEECCTGECQTTDTTLNCGACGNTCSTEEACCDSTCTSIQDYTNCGGCGITCANNEICSNEICTTLTCPTGFVAIPRGSFMMGSPTSEPEHNNDETLHQVTLTHPFCIQTTEVTQNQYKTITGWNPSYFSTCGTTCPIEQIDWHEATAYCNLLSIQEGYPECYDCTYNGHEPTCVEPTNIYTCSGYRLPTEAEWEYAARAGLGTSTYGTDLPDVAWYLENSGMETKIVKWKQATTWGLYDVLGNVWEWTNDGYANYTGDATNPQGDPNNTRKVLRGCSWDNARQTCRFADRRHIEKDEDDWNNAGFRPVRSNP